MEAGVKSAALGSWDVPKASCVPGKGYSNYFACCGLLDNLAKRDCSRKPSMLCV